MKRKLIAILAAVIMAISLFALPVMAENTDTSSDNTTTAAEPEIKGGLMAITFDDGPSKHTEKLLDELKKREAKVTFFVVGNRLDEFSDLLVREYKEGHEIASHSWDHSDLTKMSSTKGQNNLQKTEDKVYEILGGNIGPLNVRPPHGNVDDHASSYVDVPMILWDVDTSDWKSKDAERIKQHIISHAHDGAIILLHDLYGTSVEGAIAAIDELEKQGYTFVTINELFRRKGQELKAGTSYTNAHSDGIDLGPLPENQTPQPMMDEEEDNSAEKETAKKKEKEKTNTNRVDKGFPTGWLIFCIAILLLYGVGMLHMFNIIHIAPLDKVLNTKRNRKDSLNEKTAAHIGDGAADGRDRRNTSRRRGNYSERRRK